MSGYLARLAARSMAFPPSAVSVGPPSFPPNLPASRAPDIPGALDPVPEAAPVSESPARPTRTLRPIEHDFMNHSAPVQPAGLRREAASEQVAPYPPPTEPEAVDKAEPGSPVPSRSFPDRPDAPTLSPAEPLTHAPAWASEARGTPPPESEGALKFARPPHQPVGPVLTTGAVPGSDPGGPSPGGKDRASAFEPLASPHYPEVVVSERPIVAALPAQAPMPFTSAPAGREVGSPSPVVSPVEVHIGTIEIAAEPAAPPSARDQKKRSGLEAYARLRSYEWDDWRE